MTGPSVDDQARLLDNLCRLGAGPLAAGFTRRETHISVLLLTAGHVYKIKKAVDLGFVDFSSLQRRHHFCNEELRLNRRLAARIYEGVVAITGSVEAPQLEGSGEALEYAVKMRRFAEQSLMANRLAAGSLALAEMDELASLLATFHGGAPSARGNDPWGTPRAVWRPIADNFRQLLPLLADAPRQRALLTELARWSARWQLRLRWEFRRRRLAGRVRECHGDLHLGNIARDEAGLLIFDCLEFSPALRWIDVMSELAFLTMDLMDHDASPLAWQLLNGYLRITGDYAGLAVLRHYQVYRAMVRAKVGALRWRQLADRDPGKAAVARDELDHYLHLARGLSQPARPWLLITHGFSGSGKSHAAAILARELGALHLRSDVERKRLHGMGALADSAAPGVGQGIYNQAATAATYDRLAQLARQVLQAGYPVILDATFLGAEQRALAAELAAELAAPLAILEMPGDEVLLRQRIRQRQSTGNDPSEATDEVLTAQMAHAEPLSAREAAWVIPAVANDEAALVARVGQALASRQRLT